MSYIKMKLSTKPNGEVDIQTRSECTLEELKSATVYLVNEVFNKGEIDSLITALKGYEDDGTTNTEEHH